MIHLTTTDRPTFRTTVTPSPISVPAPSPDGTTLITEQQVMFSTAAAVALRPARASRWATAMEMVSGAVGAIFTDSRPPAQRYVARRYVYFENAMMEREMDRL